MAKRSFLWTKRQYRKIHHKKEDVITEEEKLKMEKEQMKLEKEIFHDDDDATPPLVNESKQSKTKARFSHLFKLISAKESKPR